MNVYRKGSIRVWISMDKGSIRIWMSIDKGSIKYECLWIKEV